MREGQDAPEGTEKDQLWDLLGRSQTPQASPYFARRVLREVARRQEEGGLFRRALRELGWHAPRAAWASAIILLAVCGLSVGVYTHRPVAQTSVAATDASSDSHADLNPQDVEVIANLDNMMAYDENQLWTEDSDAD